VDGAGNLYVADSGNDSVREVLASSGIIIIVAGTGIPGFSGDMGPATLAELSSPEGVAVDSAGNLYIADSGNNRVREVFPGTGIITTTLGNGTPGFSGDGGTASDAQLQLNFPMSVAFDSAGNFFIADTSNGRVRRVDASTGILTTVAGNGSSGCSGDGGPATQAQTPPMAWP
jgi:sugar lactone lactonase YvrE